jgi:SAM-dependent methyltransferase
VKTVLSEGVRPLWEVGSGNGNTLVPLRKAGIPVVGIEPIYAGAALTASLGLPTICGTLAEAKVPPGSLPLVGIFDVLEHIEDPIPLLADIYESLAPGGSLLVTVPAGMWLWGDLDDALGHFRRYNPKRLVEDCVSVGFRSQSVEYLYLSLVPMAVLLRATPYRLGRRRDKDSVLQEVKSQLGTTGTVDALLRATLRAETKMAKHVGLPFGLSLAAVFGKPKS